MSTLTNLASRINAWEREHGVVHHAARARYHRFAQAQILTGGAKLRSKKNTSAKWQRRRGRDGRLIRTAYPDPSGNSRLIRTPGNPNRGGKGKQKNHCTGLLKSSKKGKDGCTKTEGCEWIPGHKGRGHKGRGHKGRGHKGQKGKCVATTSNQDDTFDEHIFLDESKSEIFGIDDSGALEHGYVGEGEMVQEEEENLKQFAEGSKTIDKFLDVYETLQDDDRAKINNDIDWDDIDDIDNMLDEYAQRNSWMVRPSTELADRT